MADNDKKQSDKELALLEIIKDQLKEQGIGVE